MTYHEFDWAITVMDGNRCVAVARKTLADEDAELGALQAEMELTA